MEFLLKTGDNSTAKMKKLFLLILIFSLGFYSFCSDFSDSYEKFYQAGFSEEARISFCEELSKIKSQYDTFYVVQEYSDAKDALEKIGEISNHKMTESDIRDFQFYCYVFKKFYDKTQIWGEKLLLVTSVGFCLLLIVVTFLLRYAVKKEENYRKLKNATEISKAVEEATAETQKSERKFLYQTLHDTVSQNIKAEQIFTEKIYDFVKDKEDALRLFSSIKKIQNENLVNIRNILTSYSEISDGDFTEKITELCTNLKRAAGLDIRLLVQDKEIFNSLSKNEKESVYNIIKEALANAFRHAEAESVSVILRQNKEDCKKILIISDDGKGFDADKVDRKNHHGLEIMKKRASSVGGTLMLKSDRETGTEILVEW